MINHKLKLKLIQKCELIQSDPVDGNEDDSNPG
jgi:hypothetical protein